MAVRAMFPLALVLVLAACASAPRASLYDQFGGRPGIEALVEELLVRILEDPRINADFADTDIINLNDRLVEQICVEVGGPCTYTGRGMAEAHAGLAITQADFYALVEALVDAMQARGIPPRAQNRLLHRLAPMHRDIVSP